MPSEEENQTPFKKKHTLQERIAKAKKQIEANPDKIVIIVEKQKKANLPILSNPREKFDLCRFLCEKEYKFSMIKAMLEKKIKEVGKLDMKGKNSFFLYIKGTLPNQGSLYIDIESTMVQIYEKFRDEDGFLYMEYGDQETL